VARPKLGELGRSDVDSIAISSIFFFLVGGERAERDGLGEYM
jgi:hypothetical protein